MIYFTHYCSQNKILCMASMVLFVTHLFQVIFWMLSGLMEDSGCSSYHQI